MATFQTQSISLYYETFGGRSKPPVVLLHGLGGSGRSWGSQVDRFAKEHFVVLPDQRGVGQSTRADGLYTVAQIALDTASLLDHLDVGPAHVVGTSTGGAIAQVMALDHAARVRSVTMASSFARPDDYMKREFALRRKLMAEADMETVYSCYALFLFSPRYSRENPEHVETWVRRAASAPAEREIALKRIDMIMAHDTRGRLGDIQQPTLVVCGDADVCTPVPHSEELARSVPGSKLAVLPGGGHFIHVEQEERFFETVREFIDKN